ncbi:MAG: DUF1467 family protein [Pseudomonadota bacterium]
MTVGAALVLFAIVWFMVLFIVLPLRLETQGESGEVVKGTPKSAPSSVNLKRKALWVTGISLMIWGILVTVIVSEVVTIDTLDFYNGI